MMPIYVLQPCPRIEFPAGNARPCGASTEEGCDRRGNGVNDFAAGSTPVEMPADRDPDVPFTSEAYRSTRFKTVRS